MLALSGCSVWARILPGGLSNAPTAVPKPTDVPKPTVAAPAAPAVQPTAAVVAPVSNYSALAQPRGPWAPSGQGENFEVTCNESNCSFVKLQVWFPHSQTPWGQKEVHVLVPAGLSILVINGGGAAWEYPIGFNQAEFAMHFAADSARRNSDTSFAGIKTVDDLVKLGLVQIRFDRRVASAPTAQASQVQSATGGCKATRGPDADNKTITVPVGMTYMVDAWEPNGLYAFASGKAVTGFKGSVWVYNCPLEVAMAAEHAQGKNPIVK